MPPTERTFDRYDLILAWLAQRQYRNAHKDLRAYHDAVNTAFAKGFGINVGLPPSKGTITEDDDGLHSFFVGVARSYEQVGSPFSSYLCGPRAISEMYQKYGEPFDNAAAAMRNLHLMMLVELVERIWGGGVPHRVSQSELAACGYRNREFSAGCDSPRSRRLLAASVCSPACAKCTAARCFYSAS